MKKLIPIIVLLFFLLGCTPSDEQIRVAIEQTNAAMPTNTITITQTATNTNTPTSTATITLTPTKRNTPTPENTPTNTQTPTITSTSTITFTPTPQMLTCDIFEDEYYSSTGAQYEEFVNARIGELFYFSGYVGLVESDWSNYFVLIEDDHCEPNGGNVGIYNVPKDIALLLDLGEYIEGTGRVNRQSFLDFRIYIDIETLNGENVR